MNSVKFTILGLFITLFSMSCSSSSSTTVTPTSTTTTAFTNATAKPLFDTYCASCHASGKSDANKWLYNASDFSTIKNNIGTIYSDVYTKKTMPQGSSMSSTDLAAFKAWYDAGYSAN